MRYFLLEFKKTTCYTWI